MKEVQIEPPNNSRDNAPTRYLKPPSKDCSARSELYLVDHCHWSKGPYGNVQTS